MTNEQAYHHTLRWVNEIRARHLDLPPLDDLRPGARKSPLACAVAESFDRRARVANSGAVIAGTHVPCPNEVWEFVARFDQGRYPELLTHHPARRAAKCVKADLLCSTEELVAA